MAKDEKRRRWTMAEDDQLQSELITGLTVEEIARLHDRTVGAIRAEMRVCGFKTKEINDGC